MWLSKAVNPGLQDIILLQEQTLCGGISARTWPTSTSLPPLCYWHSVCMIFVFVSLAREFKDMKAEHVDFSDFSGVGLVI